MSALAKFDVGTLDLSGFSDADLAAPARRLRNPGVYRMNIASYDLTATRTNKTTGAVTPILDGAGKQWGSLRLNLADSVTGDTLIAFLDVPVQTLVYTSKGGSTSKVKAQIFANFIEALTGNRPTAAQIQVARDNLPSLLEGGQITVKVGYDGDHINYLGKDDSGLYQYNILMKSGEPMLNSDGEQVIEVNAESKTARENLENYYKSVKGFRPSQFGVIGYRHPSAKLSVQEEV